MYVKNIRNQEINKSINKIVNMNKGSLEIKNRMNDKINKILQ